MKDSRNTLKRRQFIAAGVIAGLVPIPVVLGPRSAAAAELPHLDESDPTAKALSYTHDASTVTAQTRGGADRFCHTCRFYLDPSATPWGPCQIFPGKAVNVNGWCKAWAAKTG